MELKNIRNFCIIAHIDHGKSTLADRLLEITWTIDKRDMKNGQMLDTMELEQERGITIKLTPVRMNWKGYQMNIIDTPGHVDFQYEVSRSLASVEGALLIVDATQWIEAQTLSNVYMAIENDLDIIPVINKIDLPAADFDKVADEIINLLGCDKSEIIWVSAKTWENVETILDEVIKRVSSPKVYSDKNPDNDELKALVFDSQYDAYRWVVSYVKVFQGEIKKGDTCHFLNTNKKIEALDVGYFSPGYTSYKKIELGTIWYVVTWLKTIRDAKVGDTMWKPENIEWPKEKPENAKPIEWFWLVTPFIYAGIFAMDSSEYPLLKDAMEKLVLNDSSLFVETDVSPALWHGYRCGFLWLLHLEIVKERLLREFGMDVIMTAPQVTYRVVLLWDKRSEYSRFLPEYIDNEKWQKCTRILISNPEELPNREKYLYIEEPIAKVEIITPLEYVWNLMQLSQERRGNFKNQQFIDSDRVMLTYDLPMNELISLSSGYASLNYEFLRYSEDDLVKLEVVIADEKVDALAFICHRKQARYLWWKLCANLKESIPKALFTIKIQAVVWWDIVWREDISAMRKDVTAKLYGWDITRKKKLLEKQKQGKKKMRQFWKVSLPSEVFVNLLKK